MSGELPPSPWSQTPPFIRVVGSLVEKRTLKQAALWINAARIISIGEEQRQGGSKRVSLKAVVVVDSGGGSTRTYIVADRAENVVKLASGALRSPLPNC